VAAAQPSEQGWHQAQLASDLSCLGAAAGIRATVGARPQQALDRRRHKYAAGIMVAAGIKVAAGIEVAGPLLA
jgi:hypothetical protein